MTATITPITRWTFGNRRESFDIRCQSCLWRIEVRGARHAEDVAAWHVCQEEPA